MSISNTFQSISIQNSFLSMSISHTFYRFQYHTHFYLCLSHFHLCLLQIHFYLSLSHTQLFLSHILFNPSQYHTQFYLSQYYTHFYLSNSCSFNKKLKHNTLLQNDLAFASFDWSNWRSQCDTFSQYLSPTMAVSMFTDFGSFSLMQDDLCQAHIHLPTAIDI